MAEIGIRIKKQREELGMTQEELAKKLGYKSKTTIGKIETGVNDITQSKVVDFAKALNTTPSYLMGWIEDPDESRPGFPVKSKYEDQIIPIVRKRFPLLGEIACGEPIFADQGRESYIMSGTDIVADFCVKARGDSMINARIYDGDIVFIRKTDEVEDGCIYAVGIDDEVTLKRIYYNEGIFQLIPENPAYKPKVITGEGLDHVTILGKAVAFQSDVR